MKRLLLAFILAALPLSLVAQSELEQKVSACMLDMIESLKIESQVKVAILSFKSTNREYSSAIIGYIYKSLFRAKNIKLVEREAVDVIIAQQELEISGLVDNEKAVSIGKLLNVDYICYGEISILNSKMIAVIKMSDVVTGEIIAVDTVEMDNARIGELHADAEKDVWFTVGLNVGSTVVLGPSLSLGLRLNNYFNPLLSG
jgi:TolB-like protein